MDLIVFHIWLLELPHMDLTVYHIWPRTTTYGLDNLSYLASNYHIWIRWCIIFGFELPHMDLIVYHIGLGQPQMGLIVYHIWHRTTTYVLDSVSYMCNIWPRTATYGLDIIFCLELPIWTWQCVIFGLELPHMDLIVYHIWLLELPHRELILYIFGLDLPHT